MATTASYTKLRDGSWGVRISGVKSKGASFEVTVTKNSVPYLLYTSPSPRD